MPGLQLHFFFEQRLPRVRIAFGYVAGQGARPQAGGKGQENQEGIVSEYLPLRDIAARASMSERTIRKHLDAIPHRRLSTHGKVWIKWSDFERWLDGVRAGVQKDEDVMEVLRDLARAS